MAARSTNRNPQQQQQRRGNPENDLSKVEFETSEEVAVTPTFDMMNLRDDLVRGIYAYGK